MPTPYRHDSDAHRQAACVRGAALTGIAEVSSRIQQIQGQWAQMATRFGGGVGGPGFASALDTAQASGGTDGSAGTAGSSTADRVGSALNSGGPTGTDVVTVAKKYLGVPYVFGGTDPATGLDCSGLVQRVFADLGVSLPRLVRHQRLEGRPVASLANAKPGDLLVFDDYDHIGIYAGKGRMLHAPQPGEKVTVGPVYETPTAIRRVLPAEQLPTSALGAADSLLRSSVLGASASGRPALAADRDGGSAGGALAGVPFARLFTDAGDRHGITPRLLAAVAKVESNYDPDAVSPAGARGLMQITGPTARELGVDPFNPGQAVAGAARLLRRHLAEFDSLPLALAAYNAGGGAVRRYGGIPPYAETQAYVVKVQNAMRALGKDAS